MDGVSNAKSVPSQEQWHQGQPHCSLHFHKGMARHSQPTSTLLSCQCLSGSRHQGFAHTGPSFFTSLLSLQLTSTHPEQGLEIRGVLFQLELALEPVMG